MEFTADNDNLVLRDFPRADAYVAFSDLSGTKALSKKPDRLGEVFHHFYQYVYQWFHDNPANGVLRGGIAISDSAIVWYKGYEYNSAESLRSLNAITDFAFKLHKAMLEKDILVKTAMRFGEFQFEKRIQLVDLQKSKLHGRAYLYAYGATAEKGKMDHGSIMLLNKPHDSVLASWHKSNNKNEWEFLGFISNESTRLHFLEERKQWKSKKMPRKKAEKDRHFLELSAIYKRYYFGGDDVAN